MMNLKSGGFWFIWIGFVCLCGSLNGAVYYLDSKNGSDANSGESHLNAWSTLAKASLYSFQAGDQILLKRGETFSGKLKLSNLHGTLSDPIVIGAYGSTDLPLPVIDAAGHLAGVHLSGTSFVEVNDLEIVANGGVTVDDSNSGLRYGILVNAPAGIAFGDIKISGLKIHHIFPETDTEHEGKNPTTYLGTGIRIAGTNNARAHDIVIQNCDIRTVGYKAIEMKWLERIDVLDNYMEDIGGPAMQPSRVNDLLVRGNTVNGSGQYSDERMHGRGSGIWPWGSERVLIEKNSFMHARGRYDSCGAHIDFNCRDVVIQYNLSVDNAGGFVEILGNNHNCAYRYNISVGDGFRVEGVDGANAHGHILWTSGFVGHNNEANGPYNCYIYNNTIYTSESQLAGFRIQNRTRGLLVANNIFYIEGDSHNEEKNEWETEHLNSVKWSNNLFQRSNVLPDDLPFVQNGAVVGDPGFSHPGSLNPEDYRPYLFENVTDRGTVIEPLPGDTIGLRIGLEVDRDFLGQPIVGTPDIGAIEAGDVLPPLPSKAKFVSGPISTSAENIEMEAVRVFQQAEYQFAEMTGNPGGKGSTWQELRDFHNDELFPNTDYAYQVSIRDEFENEVLPSEIVYLKTTSNRPYENELIWEDTFIFRHFAGNSDAPFPKQSWHMNRLNPWERDDGNGNSVGFSSGRLRLGWGFDAVLLRYYLPQKWDFSATYRLSGDWEISTTFDRHVGFIAGFAEFDSVTGEVIKWLKSDHFGVLDAPVEGQRGRFVLEMSPTEFGELNVQADSYVGIFIQRDDGGELFAQDDGKNDIYEIDNIRIEFPGEREDSDADGMPDDFETNYGFNPDMATDAIEDFDNDGLSNEFEHRVGSNPTIPDPQSVFTGTVTESLRSITLTAKYIHPDRVYFLEYETTRMSVDSDANDDDDAPDTFWKVIGMFSVSEPALEDFTFDIPEGSIPLNSTYRIRVEWLSLK